MGAILALACVAGALALLDYLARRVVGDPTEAEVRFLMALLLVVAGVSMVGLLVAFAFADAEPLRRIPGARAATIVFEWLGGATLLAILSFAALLGGGIALVVFIVGGTAAACIVLYGIAESIAYLFGISLRWGLVIACALLVVMSAAGGLIHDIRLEVMPPHAPPKEHE